MTRRNIITAVVLAIGLFGDPVSAFSNHPVPITIREAKIDANHDLVPDRMGETVTIEGTATVSAGVLHRDRLAVYLQDDTGGIKLFDWSINGEFNEGDRIRATGTIGQYRGETQLQRPAWEILQQPGAIFTPVQITLGSRLEAFEGSLVTIRGQVLNTGSNRGGSYVILHEPGWEDAFLTAFVSNLKAGDWDLSEMQPGDYLEVRGILGQHDRSEPFDGNYEVLPRREEDIVESGFNSATYRKYLAIAAGLLLASVLWIVALRSRVRKSTRQLTEAKEKLSAIYRGAQDSIFLQSLEGEIIDVNPAGCRLLEKTPQQLKGEKLSDWLSLPEDYLQPLRGINDSGNAEFHTVVNQTGDERLYNVRMSLIDLWDGMCVVTTARDVTREKKAEKALEEEKERLAVTLGCLADGVVATDTSGRIVLVNPAAVRLMGCGHEEALGKEVGSLLQVFSQNRRQPLPNPIWEVLNSGVPLSWSEDLFLLSKNGDEIAVDIRVAPILDSTGEHAGAVLVLTDTAARRKLESERLKSSKLESVGVLAGGIAHDFNNILTVVSGNLALAMMYGDENSEVHEILKDAEKASTRAKELTQKLLTFSRGGAPICRPLTLQETVESAIRPLLSGNCAVQLKMDFEEKLWPVAGDEGQLQQVFKNLVQNALQAMPDGGRLEVKAENVVLNDKRALPLAPGKYVELTISDHGMGIPTECLRQVFDPYFTTKDGSAGLGLSTAYSIVRNHNGHITLESKMAVGTTLRTYLPATDKPVQESREPVQAKARILVMDDEDMVRRMIGSLLEGAGFDVESVADGSEAIDRYLSAMEEGRPFDLVILDLTVPGGMGGKETIARLRQADSRVKSLVSSGYSNDPIMADYQRHGFAGVVQKPYSIQELQQAIFSLLES